MLNKVFLQGRIVNDLEPKTTPSGATVMSFRVAVERDFKNQNGEKETDFITVIAWKNTAEFLYKYFAKGRMIILEGRLQMRNYTDKDGNKRNAAEVIADNVYFGDSKKEDPLNGLVQNLGGTSYGAPISDNFAELSDEPGELPF